MDRFDSRLKGLKLRVDARNLFDKKTVACQSGYCYRGDRRTVIAGLSYAW
ncbi:MAG TPA: hypothetical protein VGC51_03580 [Hansschlegelia sp.]